MQSSARPKTLAFTHDLRSAPDVEITTRTKPPVRKKMKKRESLRKKPQTIRNRLRILRSIPQK